MAAQMKLKQVVARVGLLLMCSLLVSLLVFPDPVSWSDFLWKFGQGVLCNMAIVAFALACAWCSRNLDA